MLMKKLKPSEILKCMDFCGNALTCTTDNHACAYGDEGCIDCVDRLEADIQALIDAGDNLILFRQAPESKVPMTDEQRQAYEWAIAQNYPSVAARHAKSLAEYIEGNCIFPENKATETPRCDRCGHCLHAPSQKADGFTYYCDLSGRDVGQSHFGHNSPRVCPLRTHENKLLTWIPVNERLPEAQQRVLVRCDVIGTTVGWIVFGKWVTDLGDGVGTVTHWMPLPAPPDSRKPEQEAHHEKD